MNGSMDGLDGLINQSINRELNSTFFFFYFSCSFLFFFFLEFIGRDGKKEGTYNVAVSAEKATARGDEGT